jgi:putative membrane protein
VSETSQAEEWHHLHWPAFLIPTANFRSLIFAIPFLSSGRESTRLISLGFLALGVLGPLVQFFTLRYRISQESLILKGGLFRRWERVLPFSRIQSIDEVRKLRHRVFGVVELKVEAIGGSSTEALLTAVLPQEAERIRNTVLRRTEVQAAGVTEPPPLARLTVKDLLLAGATGGRVPVLALLLANAQEFIPEDRWDDLIEQVFQVGSASPLAAVMIGIVLFLLIAIAISLALTLFTYWDFTLKLDGPRLLISRGLLETRQATLPVKRIQAIWINQNLIRRILDLASLTVVVAGYPGSGKETSETSVLLPIAKRAEADRLARDVLALSDDWRDRFVGAPKAALVRRLMYALVVPLPFVIFAAVNYRGWGLAGLGVFPLTVAIAFGQWKTLGHALSPGYVVIRSGVILRRLMMVPIDNVQSLSLGSAPLQRALKLSTLRISIPKARGDIRDIKETLGAERFIEIESRMLASS